MSRRQREVVEGPQPQGENEQIKWGLDVSGWGSSPTDVTVKVEGAEGNDVTGTVTSGSATVLGDVITLPTIHSLIPDEEYRVEVKFTVGGQVVEGIIIIKAEE